MGAELSRAGGAAARTRLPGCAGLGAPAAAPGGARWAQPAGLPRAKAAPAAAARPGLGNAGTRSNYSAEQALFYRF